MKRKKEKENMVEDLPFPYISPARLPLHHIQNCHPPPFPPLSPLKFENFEQITSWLTDLPSPSSPLKFFKIGEGLFIMCKRIG